LNTILALNADRAGDFWAELQQSLQQSLQQLKPSRWTDPS
jgi:hypothetical protein